MSTSATTTSWSFLPDCLLDVILSKFIPLSGDYFRFGAVCKDWNRVMSDNKKYLRSHTQIPILLIPSKHNVKTRRSVYDVTQSQRFDSLHPRVPFGIKASGSSNGWLIYLLKDTRIVLYNPFVKSNTRSRKNKNSIGRIELPPVMAVPNAHYYEYSVPKVTLFGNPSISRDFVVLAFYGGPYSLALFKSWAVPRRWIYLRDINKNFPDRSFMDAIFYKGLIYVVSVIHGIISIDPFSNKDNEDYVEFKWVYQWSEKRKDGRNFYLVKSTKEELILIQRSRRNDSDLFNPVTKKFKVYKLCKDPDTETDLLNRKVAVHSLGGDAIFIGNGESISVCSSDFDNCQPNCIYFTDDWFMFDYGPGRKTSFGPRDMGIFNLEDNTFKPHYPYDASHKYLPPAIWCSPMF